MNYQALLAYFPWANAVYGKTDENPTPIAVANSARITVEGFIASRDSGFDGALYKDSSTGKYTLAFAGSSSDASVETIKEKMKITNEIAQNSKNEVLDFLQRFKVAVETDAFAKPEKFKEVLGLEASNWVSRGTTGLTSLGTYSRPEKWRFKDDWLNREISGTYVHFNSSNYTLRNYDEHDRYDFGVMNIHQMASIEVEDVRALFGPAQLKRIPWIGTYPHGSNAGPQRGWYVTLEYEYLTEVDRKIVVFSFNYDASGMPTNLLRVGINSSTDFIEREERKDFEHRMNTK